jgi:hypothetical protein
MLQIYISGVLRFFRRMFQVFYLDVAYVVMAMHACFKPMLSISDVSDVCFKYFIWMLHMLLWLCTHVSSICFKCFKRFK